MNFVSKKELSEHINISEKTIDRLRKQGLPWYDLGKILFDEDEVIEWIKKNKKKNNKNEK